MTSGGGVRTVAAARRRVRAQQELAQRAVAQPELGGDLLVRPPRHRGGHEGRALALGELREPAQGLADALARLDLGLWVVPGGGHAFEELGVVAVPAAQDVQRAVRRDPVEPGPHVADLGPAPQRPPRVDERGLDDVLARRRRPGPRSAGRWRSSGRR